MPTPKEISNAMDVLKAAGCAIETKVNPARQICFVIYIPLSKLED
jgi:hypothetical protein